MGGGLAINGYFPDARRPRPPKAIEAAIASRQLPVWTGENGGYAYTMVGSSPFVAATNQIPTSIKAEIFPITMTFSANGEVFDPSATSPCSPAESPNSLILQSPVFQDVQLSPGGAKLGTGQYPSELFERAEFANETTGPSALNPDYGIDLSPVLEPPISVLVPKSDGEILSTACGNLGLVDGDDWDSGVQQALRSSLRQRVRPNVLPIFVLDNVVFYKDHDPSQCCVLGYHSWTDARTPRTYIVSDFDTSGLFVGSADITNLSAEIGGWINNPYGTNETPLWGNIGQVLGCQSGLEVGAPTAGTDFSVAMPNGYTYHPQDIAFPDWFFESIPSSGENGWYSFSGSLRNPASACS